MRRREFLALLGGTTVAWPFVAQAQQSGRVYRIAFVHPTHPVSVASETGGHPYFQVFFEELRRLGYTEGHNLKVERYSGMGKTDLYADMVHAVVRSNPDLIFAISTRMGKLCKEATTAIPIIVVGSDPVTYGLVNSLARPGGNVTGVAADAGIEVWGKRGEVLKEAIPKASRVGFLAPRSVWENPYGHAMQEMAQRLGIMLLGPPLNEPVTESEYLNVFAAMAGENVDAIMLSEAVEHYTNRLLIVELAGKYRIPTMYPDRIFVKLGGLMAYGVDYSDLYRRAADEIDAVLRGTNPGDIPYYQTTKFELVINLKTAEVLGLELPPLLLARADEVIE